MKLQKIFGGASPTSCTKRIPNDRHFNAGSAAVEQVFWLVFDFLFFYIELFIDLLLKFGRFVIDALLRVGSTTESVA